MLGIKYIKVEDHQRALVFDKDKISRVLEPGKYWLSNLTNRMRIDVHDITKPELKLDNAKLAMKIHGSKLLPYLVQVDVKVNHVALVYQDDKLVEVLQAGDFKLYWKDLVKIEVSDYDISRPEFGHPLGKVFYATYEDLLQPHLTCVDLEETEVGLMYQDNKLVDVLKPNTVHLYWKGVVNTEVKVVDIAEDYCVDAKLLATIVRNKTGKIYRTGIDAIYYIEVPDNHVGLLMVNGKLESQLKPGNYGFWRFNRNIEVKRLDCRLLTMDVSGQEILTKDRVSLRVNLSANYRIVDTEKVATQLGNYSDYLYREFQLVLREAVGTRSLDDLLVDKDALNEVVEKAIKDKVLEYGLQVQSVGIKDIILPGDMKEILNQVVEAQKAAEANQIKRREETQATRSLHNTAKVMEGNPVLMRLKELEVLEKVTDRIGHITVYGGLEGVMKDLVKIPQVITDKQ